MLRIRHIMSRRVLSLRDDATLNSAAWSLDTAQVSGAPVRDEHGNLVGVLSRSDFAKLAHGGEWNGESSVREAMTPCAWSVHPDAPAIDGVKLMVEKGIHRLVVLSRPGQIEGILTSMDVMRALAGGSDFSAGAESAAAPGATTPVEGGTP
jgi:predicted transcriptional regulator